MLRKDKKKVVFVEPRGADDNFFSRFLTLPLMGPIYLATILKKRGHDVKVLNEHLLRRDVNMNDLDVDVLCITGLTQTINRSYEIARLFKLQNPSGKVIIGGIHVSMMHEEAAQFADHVVIGEGEPVIADIVEGRITDKFVRTEHINLDDYPTPDFRLLENYQKMYITPMITSRGCPFDCNFCAVTQMYGKKYRTLSIENTMKTLRSLQPKKVFFYDDNFAALRSRTYEMVKRFKRSGLDFKWTAQVRTDLTKDPKLVERMADAGLYNVYVGFESINPATLKRFNKAQGLQQIKDSIKVFHDNNINIHGMFIFGSDDDDRKVFLRTSEFCNEHGINSTQFAILVPLPGTQIYNDLEQQGRLLHKVWHYYDALHAVYRPKKMTPLELQEGMLDAFNDFYSYSRAMNDALNTLFEYPVAAIKGMYSQVRVPSFTNAGFRLMGAKIVRSWVKHNRDYMEFLGNLELKKRAMSYLSQANPTQQ
ncbi:B12-binding domain-containing radical SAM protein [Candidatus Woesearchaeota archaeon]|nr:B12-binding domain-containing radical SAM protein [Candidatus Woesearchaeota archaeon]